jgi:hypothetical protein
MSATLGTDACIRYAISYWLIFDGISASFDTAPCDPASLAMASSISRRSFAVWPGGLVTYGTGAAPERNWTPW